VFSIDPLMTSVHAPRRHAGPALERLPGPIRRFIHVAARASIRSFELIGQFRRNEAERMAAHIDIRKGLTVPEHRAAVETETGNAQNGELRHQHIALLAARVVTVRVVNSGHFIIWKGVGVEARRLMCVLVETETDRVLLLHVRVLFVLDEDERRGLRVERIQRIRRRGSVRRSSLRPGVLPNK
jgi:hypothetical protein